MTSKQIAKAMRECLQKVKTSQAEMTQLENQRNELQASLDELTKPLLEPGNSIEEQKRALTAKNLAGRISLEELERGQAAIRSLEAQIEQRKDHIEACGAGIRLANSEGPWFREELHRLQGQYRAALINERLEKLQKDSKFIQELRQLSVLCDLCYVHESGTLGQLIGDTATDRSRIVKDLEKTLELDLLGLL